MRKKATIKDIASIAGVSIATVSNVINGNSHKTSQKTITKINNVIKELNYIPNYSARSLVMKRSKLIGVIIPQTEVQNQAILENPFYSELISGIEAKLREQGYYMILTGVDIGKSYMDVFVNWNLDGAIILGIYKEDFCNQLKKFNIPILLIDSYIDDDFFYKVCIDDERGGYIATKYLIDAGHKNIAIVIGDIRKDGVSMKRFMGYKKALDEAGINYNEELTFTGHVDYDYGVKVGEIIRNIKGQVTAVFATADVLATGVITGLNNQNVKVPNDISIIGFDNTLISKMIIPALTTVNQNIYQKGYKSLEILIDVIENNYNKEKTITMPLEIIERESVKKIKNK